MRNTHTGMNAEKRSLGLQLPCPLQYKGNTETPEDIPKIRFPLNRRTFDSLTPPTYKPHFQRSRDHPRTGLRLKSLSKFHTERRCAKVQPKTLKAHTNKPQRIPKSTHGRPQGPLAPVTGPSLKPLHHQETRKYHNVKKQQ